MKVELFYHYQQYDWQDEGRVVCASYDLTAFDRSCILIKTIIIEAPDVSPPVHEEVVKQKVSILQTEKQKLQADTQVKITEIDDKIRQLQSIEYKGE